MRCVFYSILADHSRSASLCSGHSSHSGRSLGRKKREFRPLLSRGYLRPAIEHSRDTSDHLCLCVKGRVQGEGIDAEVAEWQTRYVQGVVSLRT